MELQLISPLLFKKNHEGKIYCWKVELGAENDVGYLRTTYGLYTGEKHTTEWDEVEATNVGKKNQRDSLEQAKFEYDALIKKKLEQGRYTVHPSGELVSPPPKPMLAKEYSKYADKVWESDKGVICSQPKLDGIRCLATEDGMFTRQGKLINSCPHINEELEIIFDHFPDITLDGELYNHKLRHNFQKITSLVRKTKPTPESIKETEKLVEYHVYDRVDNKHFWYRWANLSLALLDMNLKYIKLVPTFCPMNEEELDEQFSKWTAEGYEGQMVRWGDNGYEESRSKHLLKRKTFDAEEFEVIAMIEGSGDWQGAAKKFVCRTHSGRSFAAGVTGEREVLTALWKSGDCPEWATIKYFGVSNDGIPRFPVVVDYGMGERDD